MVLTGVGDVFACGHGEHGKLGQGNDNELDLYTPKQVNAWFSHIAKLTNN